MIKNKTANFLFTPVISFARLEAAINSLDAAPILCQRQDASFLFNELQSREKDD